MVDMVPISSVVSDYDKLRMTSEGHSIGEHQEGRDESAPPKANNEPDDMEDGEICEDDDEDVKTAPAPVAVTSASATTASSSSSRSSASSSAKESRHSARSSHGPQTALSSWSGTVNARAQAAAGNRSPGDSLFDPNEEYYRSGGNEDRDYRYLDDSAPVIQDFSAEGEHRSPSSPSRFDSKRRRRSVSPDDYRHGGKRARATSPLYHRSSRRAPLGRGRWADRQICKFFREGYCRDGDNCNYSHDASDSMRKAELCKFYQHGYCKKGLQCPLLHGEFPCKAFHKGECSKEQCQYSHVALNDFTKTIFDQLMKDEELAAKILVPTMPVKRKVLLPAGPLEPPRAMMMEPPVSVPMEYVPQPNPVIISDPSPSMMLPMDQSMSVMAPVAQLSTQIETAEPPSTMPDMFNMYAQQMQPELQPQPFLEEGQQLKPEHEEALAQSSDSELSGGFNINAMLAQFTSGPQSESYAPESYAPDEDQPIYSAEVNDSPASPYHEAEASTVPWVLLPVDVNAEDNIEFEEKILHMSQSNASLRLDPRLRRLLDNQFDRVSSLIGSMAQNQPFDEPPKPQSAPVATAVAARPDPRASRDPRKRPAPAPAPEPEQSVASSSNASELRVLYDGNDQHALVHGYADPNDPATWSTDVDHRPNFNQYGGSPPQPYHGNDRHYNGSSTGYQESYGGGSYRSNYRGAGEGRYRGRGRGSGHWNRERPPRDSRYHRHEYDHDDDPRIRRNGSHAHPSAPQPAVVEAPQPAPEPVAPPPPMSLREKRKDNVYESPLSRPPGARY